MGEVIRNHVMAGTGLPVTLGQMMKECDDLDEEQLQRWHELRSKLEKLGNLKQMRKVDKYLRGLRNVTAHGSTTELDNTSIESLKSWAASECSSEWTDEVRKYVDVVSRFAQPGRPLRFSDAALKQTLKEGAM